MKIKRAFKSLMYSAFSPRGWRLYGPWGVCAPRAEWRTHMFMRLLFLILPSVLLILLSAHFCVESQPLKAGPEWLIIDHHLRQLMFVSSFHTWFFIGVVAFVFAVNLYSMLGFFVLCVRRGIDLGWSPLRSMVMTLLFPIGGLFFAFQPSTREGV